MEVLKPPAGVLVRLGSFVVHIEEYLSSSGHSYDLIAAKDCLNDPQVKEWFEGMAKMALLPVKRSTS